MKIRLPVGLQQRGAVGIELALLVIIAILVVIGSYVILNKIGNKYDAQNTATTTTILIVTTTAT